jgi:hypothetical protein
MEEKDEMNERVKINFSTNAKGLVQLDITSEFKTEEAAAKYLDVAIKDAKKITAENGFKLAGAE